MILESVTVIVLIITLVLSIPILRSKIPIGFLGFKLKIFFSK